MWEEMKQFNVEFKHTWRDIHNLIVLRSLAAYSSLGASHIVALAVKTNIKPSDFGLYLLSL